MGPMKRERGSLLFTTDLHSRAALSIHTTRPTCSVPILMAILSSEEPNNKIHPESRLCYWYLYDAFTIFAPADAKVLG